MSSMREKMPTVAGWIDELREAFGTDQVNQQIRRGMNGQQAFFAEENGHRIGTPFDEPDPAKVFSGARLVVNPTRENAKGGKRGRGA